MTLSRSFLLTTLILLLAAGCQTQTVTDRGATLLNMAAEEAGMVKGVRDRLTRQLNIAEVQIAAGRSVDGKKTLADAVATLKSAASGELDQHARISGWMSVSELSRRAGDLPTANSAIDTGIEYLGSLQPVGGRIEFVLGVAAQVRALRGDGDAAKFLVASAPWAKEMPDTTSRRQALVAMCTTVMGYNDLEGGRTILRAEDDAAWRSDTLLTMADTGLHPTSFGKSVSYDATFREWGAMQRAGQHK